MKSKTALRIIFSALAIGILGWFAKGWSETYALSDLQSGYIVQWLLGDNGLMFLAALVLVFGLYKLCASRLP